MNNLLHHIMTQAVRTLDVETNKEVLPLYFEVVDVSSGHSGGQRLAGPFSVLEDAQAALVDHLVAGLEIVEVGSDAYEIHFNGECVAGCETPLSWEAVQFLCRFRGIDANTLNLRRNSLRL